MATELERLGIAAQPHLSFSQLNAFQDCGLKYKLTYLDRVPKKPQGALIGGIAVHETIAESEREGWWKDSVNAAGPDAPIVTTFLDRLHVAVGAAGGVAAVRWGGRGQGEDLTWWEKQGEFMLRRYVASRHAMIADGWGVVEGGVEMRTEAHLEGVPRPVVGYLDKFLMHEGGEPCIVDYKTGKIGSANPMQFATYARLLELERGIHVRRGIAVFLRASDAARRFGPVEFAAIVERIDESYANLARGIDAEVFSPNPNAWCDSCAVNASCWFYKGTRPTVDGLIVAGAVAKEDM